MAKENETVVTVISEGLAGDPSLAAGVPCLVVLYGKNLGKRYFLDREVIVGRSESATIQVDQESVSRHHVKLETDGGRTTATDLSSTNGSFINNARIGSMELRDGDQLKVGQTIFKYLSGSNIESKYHEEIYRLTTVDGLTQAFNKRYFLDALTREVNRATRYGRALSLAMMDIDHFKLINDTHGHLAGDLVLREMAALIMQHLRREDIFARYGGEEFSLILPEVDLQGAAAVCEKLRGLIEVQPFEFNGKQIPVTVSQGLRACTKADAGVDVVALIADADAKLYEAKQGGRNRVCA
jgi:two-component system, cell cycle response regulator